MEGKALIVVSVTVLLIVVVSKLKSLLIAKPKLNLPPGPWTLPVIGSLHHLVTSPNLYRAIRRLAQKHGPVMMLRLGEVPAVAVSSPEAVQEVMKAHDIAFAEKHLNATLGTLFFNGNGMGFAPYGERWRQLRKLSVVELFSAARVMSFRHIREEEVARFMLNLTASCGRGVTVDLTMMISRFVNDTFVRESMGSRCLYQDEYLDAVDTAMKQTTGLTAADLFPSSRLVQVLGMAPRKVLACRNRIQRILEQIIEEKSKGSTDRVDEVAAGNEGILDVLLRLQKDSSTPIPLTDETLMAMVFEMSLAGSETSSTTLNWCMTELVRSPAAMVKAQAEVRDAFNGKNNITEQDIEGLSNLKLVIKEALRLHTPAPVIPQTCRKTCQIMGYDIPKGTVMLVNVWAICRDPKYWDDPEEFKPERFVGSNVDYKGTNYEFLPFGSGRRICPGITLGICNIELALASLLYHFDWKLPDGMEPKDVDVCEGPGIVGGKKTNLVLHPIIHIPPANA